MPIELLVLGDGGGIPPDDHGALYGDGVFRTVLVHAGRVVAAPGQIATLLADARAIGLSVSEGDGEALAREAGRLARVQQQGTQRWSITSGSGARGYARPPAEALRAWITPTGVPAVVWRDGEVRLRTLSYRYGTQPRLAGIKHMNRLDNVMARRELAQVQATEGIICDGDGNAVGGTMSNLVFCDDEALYTPSLDRGGVAGYTLSCIKSEAEGLNVRVVEVREPPAAIVQRATGVAVCNSVMGLCRVREWDGAVLGQGEILDLIRTRLGHPVP